MEEKRINTIVTEESIVESLHKQLDNNEFSMLEKALKHLDNQKAMCRTLIFWLIAHLKNYRVWNIANSRKSFQSSQFRLNRKLSQKARYTSVYQAIRYLVLCTILKVHTALQRNSIRFQRKYSWVFISKIGVLNRSPLNLKSPMNSGHFYPLNKYILSSII